MANEDEPDDIAGRTFLTHLYTCLGTRMIKCGRIEPYSEVPDPAAGEETLYVLDLLRSDGVTETITLRTDEAMALLTNLTCSPIEASTFRREPVT